MSASLKTQNYELPIFVADDIPAWLVDWNNAMTEIDTAIASAKQSGTDAESAVANMQESISTLSSTVLTLSNNYAKIQSDLTDLNSQLSVRQVTNIITYNITSYRFNIFYNANTVVIKGDGVFAQNSTDNAKVNGISCPLIANFGGNIFGLTPGSGSITDYTGTTFMVGYINSFELWAILIGNTTWMYTTDIQPSTKYTLMNTCLLSGSLIN